MAEVYSYDAHVRDYYTDQLKALAPYDFSDRAADIYNGYASVVPGPDGKPVTEWSAIDLDQVWGIQTARLIELGFDKALGFETPEDYLTTLPRFSPKPPEFEGRFDIPVLIDPRISLMQLAQLAGVNFNEDSVDVHDFPESGFVTPIDPYNIWVDIKDVDYEEPIPERLLNAEWSRETQIEILSYGEEQRNATTIPVIRKRLKEDERGAVALEGVFCYLYNPEIFEPDLLGRDINILMVGSESMDPNALDDKEIELRLFLGRYTNAEIWLDNNGDSAIGHIDHTSRALLVGLL